MTFSIDPFIRLTNQLEIPLDDLVQVERVDRLASTFDVSSHAIAGLDAAMISDLIEEYRSAVRVRISTGSLDEFVVEDGSFNAADLTSLVEEAGRIDSRYRAAIQLDKVALVRDLIGSNGGGNVHLFLFRSVLINLLEQPPANVERDLWHDPTKRLVLAVLDSDLNTSGPCLSLVGGMHQGAVTDELLKPVPDDLERIASRRNDYIGWDSALSTRLTPLHFDMPTDADTPFPRAPLAQLTIGLGTMYLCDRARLVERSDGSAYTQAEFRGREHVAYIPIDWATPIAEVDRDGIEAMLAVVSWCYELDPAGRSADLVGDRLPFVQTRVAQLLESRPERERLLALVLAMPAINEGVRWHWRSFIEGRVAEYLEHVRELESAVSEAVAALTTQTGSLVKRLSETSLAALAALIGSFIAAAFRDPFHADLFRIGMLAYAGYVVVFPLGVGVSSTFGDARVAIDTFHAQRNNLAEVLGSDRVDEIVASRPTTARNRFVFWTKLVSALYVVAAITTLIAAFAVPNFVDSPQSNSSDPSPVQPTD